MRYFIFILSFLSLGLEAQQPQFATFLNNAAVDTMGNFTLTVSGATYSTTHREPTHSASFGDQTLDKIYTSEEFNLNTGTGVAISCWVYTAETTDNTYLFAFGLDGLRAWFNTANRAIKFRDEYGSNDASTGSNSYSLSTWTHLVFVKYNEDGGNGKIFINGVDATIDSSMNSPIDYTHALTIGNLPGTEYNSFDGLVDGFQVYYYAPTPSQIDSLYDHGATNFILYDAESPAYIPTQYQMKDDGLSYRPIDEGYVYDPRITQATPEEAFTIYETWDFEDQPLGQFTEAELETYFSGSTAYIDAGYENNLQIITETINGDGANKALEMIYPANATDQLYFWDYPLNSGSGYSEIYIGMNIKYGDDDLTNWSSQGGGKNFGIKGYPWNFLLQEPGVDEGFYVVPIFSESGLITHYFYNHWENGYGNNSTYPAFGTNTHYNVHGVWYNLTMRAKMNTCASCYDGILEILMDGYPVYQYNNYRFYEDVTLMSQLIDVIEFTYFQGGQGDEYQQDEEAHVYWDDIMVWMPDNNPAGLNTPGVAIDLPNPVTGEIFHYTTLITTPQTFTNSQYGSNYSAQRTEAWLIDAGEGNTVTLTINTMDLDNDVTYHYDMVKIYDGNTPNADLIGRHVSALPSNFPDVDDPITSTGRYIYVIFESDRNGTVGSGFSMTVTFN